MKLVIHIDGGSRGNPGPAAAGVVVRQDGGDACLEAGYFLGRMTNNQAEYHGLLRALEAATKWRASEVHINADSELLVRQINGDYRVKNAALKDLFDEASTQLQRFKQWRVQHVRREFNRRADELANMAMDAGEDVIMTSIPPEGSAAPGRAARRGPSVRPVTVACLTAPRSEACPAPCRDRQSYLFDATVPAGLCLHAALAVIPAVAQVAERRSGRRVACPLAGCGAEFEVNPSDG